MSVKAIITGRACVRAGVSTQITRSRECRLQKRNCTHEQKHATAPRYWRSRRKPNGEYHGMHDGRRKEQRARARRSHEPNGINRLRVLQPFVFLIAEKSISCVCVKCVSVCM